MIRSEGMSRSTLVERKRSKHKEPRLISMVGVEAIRRLDRKGLEAMLESLRKRLKRG